MACNTSGVVSFALLDTPNRKKFFQNFLLSWGLTKCSSSGASRYFAWENGYDTKSKDKVWVNGYMANNKAREGNGYIETSNQEMFG